MSEPVQQPVSKPSDAVLEAWESEASLQYFTTGQYGPTRLDFNLGRAYERLVRFEAYEENRAREP